MTYNITPVDLGESHKTGSLPATLSVTDIEQVLGFAASVNDFENKVEFSWSFEVNGNRCGIWDYKGSRWSVYDPQNVLPEIFAEAIAKPDGKAQHTPGLWQRFDNGGVSGNHEYGPAFADCVWGPRGPGHGLIADCSPNGQQATPETIANARLIAAAPELLEALLAAFGYVSRRDHPATYKMCSVAVAKATGKEVV
jgi:hypothetical protein